MSDTTAFAAPHTALLTGAASPRGIGRAVARRLARDGWTVAIADIADAEQAAAELEAETQTKIAGYRIDVSDPASVDAAVTAVEQELPPIVGLVNLAGISSATGFLELTPEEWDRVLAINLSGAFLITQRVLRGMVPRRIGRIVNISSISAQRGGGTYSTAAYSAAKAGLLGLTRAVAREVGEFGITANAIAPGPVDTDIMGGTLSDERRAAMAQGSLIGRIGTPDDIAALIAFLLSEDAGLITAATYDINGGLQIS